MTGEETQPNWYECPCGCGWVREDKAHLVEYLVSTGYGLDALLKAAK